jgi:hypothetical protein
MIDAFKFMTFLSEHGLKAEEFWLLYCVMVQEQNNKNGNVRVNASGTAVELTEFSKMAKLYFDNGILGNQFVDYVALALGLEERGFVEIWARKDDSIKLKDMKITSKFREKFAVDSAEEALQEIIAIYPKAVRILKQSRIFPSVNKTIPELAKIYDEYVLKGGSMLNHKRCLILTEKYLQDQGNDDAPMNLENYFKQFEGIAMYYESGQAEQDDSDSYYNDL